MFVCAAAGGRVAKHGNRAVSSKSGSADVLEALGANINLKPEQVGRCIDEVGVGFMFAPAHHAAMKHAAPVRRELGVRTFNISTASIFVAAAAGARVAKHGGRAVSSQSGSADVLEALGVNINLKPDQVAQCIDESGVGFMFAPNHHAAMKHAAPVRRELGVRTIFNILGPLTNPAGAPTQLMGVFHPDLVGIQIRVLQRLGARHAMTVFGLEGLDEISISGKTMIGELKDGRIEEYSVHPERFGLPLHDPRTLRVETVEESRAMVLGALENKLGAARDIVALNAGAAIYVAGKAASMEEGVEQAFEAIASGAARSKLDKLAQLTQTLGGKN